MSAHDQRVPNDEPNFTRPQPQLTAEEKAADTAAMAEVIGGQRQKTSIRELVDSIIGAGLGAAAAKDVIAAEVARELFDQDVRLAKMFAWSGVFGDLKNVTEKQAVATAMAKIQLGRNWGLSAADSMQYIFFTNGKPSIMNEILAAKMRDAGYDWDVQWHEDKGKCTGCTLWPKKWDGQEYKPLLDRQGNVVSVGFTKADADTAIIHEKGNTIKLSEKWNFISWPRDMYFWRAIARLKRYYVTNVLTGALTVEEAEEIVPERDVDNRRPAHQQPFRIQPRSAAATAPRPSDVDVAAQAEPAAEPEAGRAEPPADPEREATALIDKLQRNAADSPAPTQAGMFPGPGLSIDQFSPDQVQKLQAWMRQARGYNRAQLNAWLSRYEGTAEQALTEASVLARDAAKGGGK